MTMGDWLARSKDPSRAIALLSSVVVIVGFLGWAIGIYFRYYDYDEIGLAHSIWLVSQGLRPYHDFFEVHPPFLWFILAPISGLVDYTAHILTFYRTLSVVGFVFFVSGLFANMALALPSHKTWTLWAVVSIVFYPAISQFAMEFRPDSWAYGIFLWALWRWRIREGHARNYLEFGFLTGASVLMNPKLAVLACLVPAFDSLRLLNQPRVLARRWRNYLGGLALALLVGWLILWYHGVNVALAFTSVVVYHWYFNRLSSLGFGLLNSIAANYLLLIAVGLGITAWIRTHARNRRVPDSFEMALAAFLVIQALLVAPPYKQYYAPWFLFGAYFLCYLGPALEKMRPLYLAVVIGAIAVISLAGIGESIYASANSGGAVTQRYLITALNRIALPDDRVVISASYHPIFRRDVFFGWMLTEDPDGFGTEYVTQKLDSLKVNFSQERYRSELREHPPAVIYLGERPVPSLYYPRQNKMLLDFIRERRYRVIFLERGYLALREDAFGRFLNLVGNKL